MTRRERESFPGKKKGTIRILIRNPNLVNNVQLEFNFDKEIIVPTEKR